jgi:microsomal dipeptidase-like Zn-dependent dipeptidase
MSGLNEKIIKKVEPHIDIADMHKFFGYSKDDFFSNKDIPVTLSKLKKAGVQVLGTTLYFDEESLKNSYYEGVRGFYDWYKELFSMTDEMYEIERAADIDKNSDKIATLYTIEGVECFRMLDDFYEFYELGVRLFGLTWEERNDYACGRHTKDDTGLSAKGVELMRLMSQEDLILDIAHLSENSVKGAAADFEGMIVTTHGNCRSVYETRHNITDYEIEIIVERGGVVSLFPLSEDTGHEGTFEEFFAHVEYIADRWGEDYVAFSSDIYPMEEYPFLGDCKDVLILNRIEEMLVDRVGAAMAEKLLYGNWMRVLGEAL